MAKPISQATQRYAAPALEKGLDILELLAGRGTPLGQSEIARALGRTPAEIFRMLNCLDRRGYLLRGRDERYRLSAKLFELAHRHPPTHLLLDAALPQMRWLAHELGQSCHLVIRHDDGALVVAQVDSPGFIGFSVRVGAQVSLTDTCSGRVLVAFGARERDPEGFSAFGAAERAEMEGRLDSIRARGFEEAESRQIRGITDVGAPVLGHDATAVAALTVPCLTPLDSEPDLVRVRARLLEAAGRIRTALGGADASTGVTASAASA